MVPIAEPIRREVTACAARDELVANGFDLALVEGERLQIVTLKRLKQLERTDELDASVVDFGESPHRDRLIEASMPIRKVVGRLMHRSEPLLVVGERGVTHIVTIADFAGVAGTAVVLSFMLAVDRALNELLRPHAKRAMRLIGEDQRGGAEKRQAKAAKTGAALDIIDYLTMGDRIFALRSLDLLAGLGLSPGDETLLLDTRNKAAHLGLSEPYEAMRAIGVAEAALDQLADARSA